MIWDKYGYLTMVPREERGEWYEKTSLSNVDEVELIKTIQISKQNRAGQIAHHGIQIGANKLGLRWNVSELEDMVNLKTEILKNNGDCGMSQ